MNGGRRMETWLYETESGYNGTVKADDADRAAKLAWAELCGRNPDFYRGGVVYIWMANAPQPRLEFEIEVESIPAFHAKRTGL